MLWLLHDLGLRAHAYAPVWGLGFMLFSTFTNKQKQSAKYLRFYAMQIAFVLRLNTVVALI